MEIYDILTQECRIKQNVFIIAICSGIIFEGTYYNIY